MLRFMNAANAITLLALWAAVACALFGAAGKPAYAIVALIVSGVCDFLDGAFGRRIARTEEEKTFGGRLDSVADACSFGLAPALLFWSIGMRTLPEMALIAIFSSCAVWRLAYFDTVGLETSGAQRSYIGLPTTFVALVLPLAFLVGFAGEGPLRVTGVICAAGLALAMVSSVRIPKPGGVFYVIFPLVAIGVGGTYLAFASQFPGAP